MFWGVPTPKTEPVPAVHRERDYVLKLGQMFLARGDVAGTSFGFTAYNEYAADIWKTDHRPSADSLARCLGAEVVERK